MSQSERYRPGQIEKRQTGNGPCWYFRYQQTIEGRPVRKRIRIGLVSEYPTRAAAMRAASGIREEVNSPPGLLAERQRRFEDVIARYEREEMPERYSTRSGYQSMIRVYIRPKWGQVLLADVSPYKVRTWLLKMDCSTRYRGHVHGMMRVLFKFAMLWEWMPMEVNPMSLFSLPGATKRSREPETISLEQYQQLLPHLQQPFRLMAQMATGLGLRCSEFMALRWGNLNVLEGKIHITRAIVEGREGDVKTQHSKKALPLHPLLVEALLAWRHQTEFNKGSDYIFASPAMAGEKPYRSGSMQTRKLVPAGKAIGLPFRLGWHTFRHSYRAMLRRRGTPIDVQRDLMRHADVHTTTQVYGGVDVEELREANSGLVESLFGGKLQ
ncbi:MAG TPA: site-specific integrase [Edaphobacter sp.]|nr:site-specific integrase [Edaphobacter sp.]